MKSFVAVALLLLTGACSDDGGSPPAKTPPAVTMMPSDGGATAVAVPPGSDPSAVHFDDHEDVRPVPPPPLSQRERRAIDVTLRSSPPGARVAVDGTAVGVTPAFWSGYADGREHEFVFTVSGHSIARYRFVPVSSGVIHARLDPIAEERDAGIAPPPEVVPQPPQPSAVVPPAPPPTIAPPDAMVAPVVMPLRPPPTDVGPQP